MNLKRFFTTEVEKNRLLSMVRASPSLAHSLIKCKNDEIDVIEFAQKQFNQEEDDFITIQVIGDPGSGKSGVGQAIAERTATKPVLVDHIKLQYDAFLESTTTLQKGEYRILDEQTRTHGTGSRRIGDDILNIIETLRKNGGSIILISPTEKAVRTEDVHLELRVLARDSRDVLIAWKSRTPEYLGSFVLRLNWNSPLWREYCAVKDDFIAQARERAFHKTPFLALANKVLEHPDAAKASKKLHYRLILEKIAPYLTGDENKLVLAQIEMIKKG